MTLNHVDLFAGIGGFSYGLECSGGFQTVAFCERNKFCQNVIRKHWPGIEIFEDVRNIETDRIGRVDSVSAGFPCQPYSVAGVRRGTEDDRYLWPETLAAIDILDPSWFIGENVTGLISMGVTTRLAHMEGGRIERNPNDDLHEAIFVREENMLLNQFCEDLESIGYEVQTFVVPACGVDAPHQRYRVWIVAHRNRRRPSQPARGQREGGLGPEFSRENVANAGGELFDGGEPVAEQAGWTKASDRSQDGPDTNSDHAQGLVSGVIDPQERTGSIEGQAGPFRSERGRFWLPESGVGRVAHGVPGRVDRLGALGNAVVPEVVERFGEAILHAEREAA